MRLDCPEWLWPKKENGIEDDGRNSQDDPSQPEPAAPEISEKVTPLIDETHTIPGKRYFLLGWIIIVLWWSSGYIWSKIQFLIFLVGFDWFFIFEGTAPADHALSEQEQPPENAESDVENSAPQLDPLPNGSGVSTGK